MADENEARIYGMADQANRDPPPVQGTRGEKASAGLDLSHPVALEDGRIVTVSEASGVAYTEATGRAGTAPRQEAEEASDARPRSKAPLIAAGLVAGVAAGAWLARRLRPREPGRNWPLDIGEAPAPARVRLVVIRPLPRLSLRASRI